MHSIFSTEYEIQAEIVEIDTQKNLIKYLEKVTFNSNEISFKANELIVNQNNEQIDASGSPIELSFRENGEKINGQANKLQIIQNTLSALFESVMKRLCQIYGENLVKIVIASGGRRRRISVR